MGAGTVVVVGVDVVVDDDDDDVLDVGDCGTFDGFVRLLVIVSNDE